MKKPFEERVFLSMNNIFMFILTCIFIYPLWHVLMASISLPDMMRSHSGLLLTPQGFTTMGYEIVFRNPNIAIGYGNTLFYVIVGSIINIIMTTLGAYALSRKDFMFKRPMMLMVTFTMFFSGGLIPSYLLVNNLNMLDTRWAILIPGAISTYNLIVLRTSFQGIPAELEESAKIDGANDLRILWSIILPVSKASLAVITLFYAVSHWNSWFQASIYLTDRTKFPLQLILREILLKSNTSVAAQTLDTSALQAIDQGDMNFKELVQYSTIIISTAPILCVYPFVQKYFVKGVMIGSLKG